MRNGTVSEGVSSKRNFNRSVSQMRPTRGKAPTVWSNDSSKKPISSPASLDLEVKPGAQTSTDQLDELVKSVGSLAYRMATIESMLKQLLEGQSAGKR